MAQPFDFLEPTDQLAPTRNGLGRLDSTSLWNDVVDGTKLGFVGRYGHCFHGRQLWPKAPN
jgi:hypothetical protein